jgi:hypothetical protein
MFCYVVLSYVVSTPPSLSLCPLSLSLPFFRSLSPLPAAVRVPSRCLLSLSLSPALVSASCPCLCPLPLPLPPVPVSAHSACLCPRSRSLTVPVSVPSPLSLSPAVPISAPVPLPALFYQYSPYRFLDAWRCCINLMDIVHDNARIVRRSLFKAKCFFL